MEKEKQKGKDRWVRVPNAHSSHRRLSFVSAVLPNVARPGSPATRAPRASLKSLGAARTAEREGAGEGGREMKVDGTEKKGIKRRQEGKKRQLIVRILLD